jgi:hypothetical protein
MDDVLFDFPSITLEEMSGIRLLNRIDTKFLTVRSQLDKLLQLACNDYMVQEVNHERNIPYCTLYFDTPEHDMYLAHQNGKKIREKVRIRSYVNSGLEFLEVKHKDNHGRTHKKRILVNDTNLHEPHKQEFLRKQLPYDPELLNCDLVNEFKRITLVNKEKTERLTIDTDLKFHNPETNKDCDLVDLVVIELKRDSKAESHILETLRQMHVKPANFSKYCMGLALTNHSLKQNNFKPRLHTLFKILGYEPNPCPSPELSISPI